jgi:hypothetical protein
MMPDLFLIRINYARSFSANTSERSPASVPYSVTIGPARTRLARRKRVTDASSQRASSSSASLTPRRFWHDGFESAPRVELLCTNDSSSDGCVTRAVRTPRTRRRCLARARLEGRMPRFGRVGVGYSFAVTNWWNLDSFPSTVLDQPGTSL